MSTKLILASSSRFRKELLSRLSIEFEVQSPMINETPLANETARETSLRLAVEKAGAIAKKEKSALIIGADQVALCDNLQIGKPMTVQKAMKILQTIRNKEVEFFSSVCLINSRINSIHTHTELSVVKMRGYSDKEIQDYLNKEPDCINCTGALKSEARGAIMIERISNNDPSAITGLPMIQLTQMLRSEGIL